MFSASHRICELINNIKEKLLEGPNLDSSEIKLKNVNLFRHPKQSSYHIKR